MPTNARYDRRDFLRHGACAVAAGGVALRAQLAQAAALSEAGVLAPRPAHFEPRAKHLIVVFLTGGFSHVDTFDPKPRLTTDHGKIVPSVDLRGDSKQPLMGSPFRFSPCGRSGLMISELFPQLGSMADELCVVRSLHTDIVEHFQAMLAMHTGSATVPLPSLGCWLSYGLGTFNQNLPSYLVLCEHMPYAGAQNWDCNFLPPEHQGVRIVPGPEPIPDLRAPQKTGQTSSLRLDELEQQMLRDLNERHASERKSDARLAARTESFSVARGLMREAPALFDVSDETATTLADYGTTSEDKRSFSYQCLLARRMVERGVRVVELIDTGSSDNWDAHGDMQNHVPKAKRVDRPLGALLRDLKQRGLLDSTLVAICTEFGRAPWTDNATSKGRNHYARAFSSLLAGGGVRGGITYGETDEYGINIVADPCHVHDYHATILHLMGIDHTRLTYRYAGRDFRLTDVHGRVLEKIIA